MAPSLKETFSARPSDEAEAERLMDDCSNELHAYYLIHHTAPADAGEMIDAVDDNMP